jgi:hypothetical protein
MILNAKMKETVRIASSNPGAEVKHLRQCRNYVGSAEVIALE